MNIYSSVQVKVSATTSRFLTTEGFTTISSTLRKMIFKIVFNGICKWANMIRHAHSIPHLTPYTIAFTPTIKSPDNSLKLFIN